jgi:hypothetical protein
VSKLQELLKRFSASTKGSKAELVQILVRYVCLFSNDGKGSPMDNMNTFIANLFASGYISSVSSESFPNNPIQEEMFSPYSFIPPFLFILLCNKGYGNQGLC